MSKEMNVEYVESVIRGFVSDEHTIRIRDRKYRFDVYVYMQQFDIRFEFVKKSNSLAIVLFFKDDADEAAYYKNVRAKDVDMALDLAEYFYRRAQRAKMFDLIEVLESKVKLDA